MTHISIDLPSLSTTNAILTGYRTPTTLGYLTFTLAIMVLAAALISRIKYLFNGIPGPRLGKVTRLWKLYHSLRGDFLERLRELHRKYGVVVQIGPYEYNISDPLFFNRREADVLSPNRIPAPGLFETLRAALKMYDLHFTKTYGASAHAFNRLLILADVETGRTYTITNP